MKFQSQKIAYWFFASAMALLLLQIVYGFIMGFARIVMDGLHEWIPFNTARAVHTNLLVVHSLTDHRRELFLDRTCETLHAPPEFMLIVSISPGYQRSMRELKPSTRQRFIGLGFGYPSGDLEARIITGETGLEDKQARSLVSIAKKVRALTELSLLESVSTRLLVDTAKLIQVGLPPRYAAMFEWEENVFLGLKALYKRLVEKPREREAAAVRIELKPRRQQLFLLANMIAQGPVNLFETANAVLCDHERVFLPTELSCADSLEANAELFQLKTLLAAFAIKNHFFEPQSLLAEIPALQARIEALRPALGETDFWQIIGEPDFSHAPIEEARKALLDVQTNEQQPESVTEIEGKGQTNVTVLQGEDDQTIESEMPIHTFEKAETLEEYSGLNRKNDVEDELDEHAEALRSVDMKHVVRTRERPRSIYRTDIVMDGLAFEVGDDATAAGIPYPEWDYKKHQHKPDWCFIRQHTLSDSDASWAQRTGSKHRSVILDMRKKMAALATQAQRTKRQPAGPELDIDAVVAAQVASRSGHSPDDRLYIQRQRKLHDVAALILMDQSFSTDAWLDDARVLDTIRETLFCVGEVMDEFIETFAVAGFSSNTRRQCDFHLIKDFTEPWRGTRARLGSLEAQGYTRVGTALRHAQELLIRQPAEKRVIFLITDGRPCDYDRYEGEYGIRYVRKAIENGNRHGIMTHAFAIEKRACEQFPRMFSRQHYDIVPNPRALVDSMCGAFARLKLAV